MTALKSERHHWWPECVSDFWKDGLGLVNWLWPDGFVRAVPPKNLGVIVNGHTIKMGAVQKGCASWGENFEREFDFADSNFPKMIRWLQGLERANPQVTQRRDRFLRQSVSDKQIAILIECLVSLAVRSPMNRAAAVSVAERLRGPLEQRERNVLIGANMRHEHRRAVETFGTRGKIAVIYSPKKEFIFGDGFYHNLLSPSRAPSSVRILAPLTPEISVLYTIPFRYLTEPRLTTLIIDPNEAEILNKTVQIYARNALFYRSEKPELIDEYGQGCHLQFDGHADPIEHIIRDLSGIG